MQTSLLETIEKQQLLLTVVGCVAAVGTTVVGAVCGGSIGGGVGGRIFVVLLR